MGKVIKTLVSLPLVPILFAAIYALYVFGVSHVDLEALRWFFAGILGYLIIYALMGSRMEFIEIFEHEFIHMVMAWVFLQRVQTFFVSTDRSLNGGLVGVVDSPNFLIVLAPYFLPLFTLPFLLLKHIFPANVLFDIAIGATLAFHYVGLLREFRRYQPDLINSGLLFSCVVTGVFNALILVVTLCVVQDDSSGLSGYFANLYDRSLEIYRWIAQRLRRV